MLKPDPVIEKFLARTTENFTSVRQVDGRKVILCAISADGAPLKALNGPSQYVLIFRDCHNGKNMLFGYSHGTIVEKGGENSEEAEKMNNTLAAFVNNAQNKPIAGSEERVILQFFLVGDSSWIAKQQGSPGRCSSHNPSILRPHLSKDEIVKVFFLFFFLFFFFFFSHRIKTMIF
jgi:hypothetical protein